MKTIDIEFDDSLEMYIVIENIQKKVCVSLSDSLLASEEELTEEYKIKIASFINHITSWYDDAIAAIISYSMNVYKTNISYNDLTLNSIYILFEQDEEELFGVSFRSKFNTEHGNGVKIKGKNYAIVEVGEADVAFSYPFGRLS